MSLSAVLLSGFFITQYLSGLLFLPMSFDWRNINGVNYLSPLRNQHQIVENHTLCGICWAMATTSTIADRMNIYMGYSSNLKNYLSVQSILDCIPYTDSCEGGNEIDVYKYIMEYGVPHETCNVYRGYPQQCIRDMECYRCNYHGKCHSIQSYEKLYIKGYGKLINASVYDIKREIYQNGPITCAIKATKGLEEYTSGIYKEYNTKIDPNSNHVVSIIGWGYENDTEYYIVRNSWGYPYGEDGFFRIVTGNYRNGTGKYWNLGIEQDCSYPLMGEWRRS
uniref:Peptidase C1A papain C-terminal domain-containing protein n=1 Tax=viral metagenome TaxID=1070528 RepID=A0A6C0CTN3_9ZZZZ